MANIGGKRNRSIMTPGDVLVKNGSGVSLITQEMRAQGMNLTENLLQELGNRNLAEIKTVDLVKLIVQLMGFFLPKANNAGDAVIDVTGNQGVMDIMKQIGLGAESDKK